MTLNITGSAKHCWFLCTPTTPHKNCEKKTKCLRGALYKSFKKTTTKAKEKGKEKFTSEVFSK